MPAVRILQHADHIESRLIGPAASQSEQHLALQKLIEHEQSDAALIYLLADDNPVSQLYGLLGLQQSGSELFDTYLPFIEHSSQKVFLQSGCFVYAKPVADFVTWSERFNQTRPEKKGVLFTRPVMP